MKLIYTIPLFAFFIVLNSNVLCQQPNFNMESHTKKITVNNEDFPVIDFGEGIPVILLHGFPDSKALWENQIPFLAEEGYRVIAPDLRGVGNAPRPLDKDSYAMPKLMADVIGIMAALGVEKAHLVGHDWGAALGWALATYQPQYFYSYTALSVGSPASDGWNTLQQKEKSWYFYFFLQKGLAEHELTKDDWALTRTFLKSRKDIDQLIQRLAEPNALTTALNWYRGNMGYLLAPCDGEYTPVDESQIPASPKITIPVMGIWSEEDNYLLEPQMKGSAAIAENSFTYKKLENAGHWMMLDQPEKVNELLISFFNGLK